ncbi:hypothetical protein IZ6_16460 [Terrihabitans soli]|uniref:Uncharacterized protein n=2 Tax=Terrihabitans soli TaxID=708113 RepID=A0A6S6QUZ1_9HYPH|nr:hypothetical protein IZ6_16460 [Terrihabitans soli]
MLRGFLTTFAVVSAVMLGAWAYTDTYRTAGATAANPEMTPAATSATTNSNLAAKGDRLDIGTERLSVAANGGPALDRIISAHAKALEANASGAFVTVSVPSGHNETTLMRVPIRD